MTVRRAVFQMFIIALAVSGCSGMAINYDYDPRYDFQHYETWDWLPGEWRETGEAVLHDPLVQGRVEAAIEVELGVKGHVRSTDSPDFFVAYFVTVREQSTSTTINEYYAGTPYQGQEWTYTLSQSWEEGALVMDFIDAEEQRIVWRGSAEAEVKPNLKPEKRNELLRKAVRKMLEHFPPG